MWDEDPRWQEGHYKVAVWSAIVLGLLSLVSSAITGDWSLAEAYFTGLGVFLAALCLYAAVVWMVARGVLSLVRLLKSDGKRQQGPKSER